MPPKTDIFFLEQALEQAQSRRGFCAPNPSVGAVLVNQGIIIATGSHYAAGHPHAEIDALNKITTVPPDTTLFVTLEPCCHFGKTPPCTDAIIQAGIKQVIYGYRDPNPLVAGQGESQLKAAGISCTYLNLPAIDLFYQSYNHWQKNKTPWVTAKLAMSLDGKIAGPQNQPLPITGPQLGSYTHQHRKRTDAILTTAKTIFHDDPKLNVRDPHKNETFAKPLYILDSYLTLSENEKAQIFKTAKTIILFHHHTLPEERRTLLISKGARCIAVDSDATGLLDLNQVIQFIGADGIHDLWIEAGAQCFSAFIEKKLVQQALLYIAPWTVGEGISAFQHPWDFRKRPIQWEQIGHDIICKIDLTSE